MDVLQLALAIACLTAPPDTLKIADQQAMHRLLAPALTALALHWELLDPRESDCFKNAEDFAADLKMLQGRFAELRCAPHLNDLERFPDTDLVKDMLRFNHSFHEHVSIRLGFDTIHDDDLRATLLETDDIRRIYAAVLDARCDHYQVAYRRKVLSQLRELVGFQDFYAGRLPPHVPIWRIPDGR